MSFDAPVSVADVFAELCAIPSPSLREARVAESVERLVRQFGLSVRTDDAGPLIGGDQSNLSVVVPAADGSATGGVLVAAHLDTVPTGARIEPVELDGWWTNGADGILGADNKAAVAALVCAVARWSLRPPPVPVMAAFTVAEEIGLLGAARLDLSEFAPRAAFVFDHPTPIGTVVGTSPWRLDVRLSFTGVEAHAGIAAGSGANAIAAACSALACFPQGMSEGGGTSNLGTISGGVAGNVVAGECHVGLEIRDPDPERLSLRLQQVVERAEEAASSHGCSVEVAAERTFCGYDHASGHDGFRIAEMALSAIGIEAVRIDSAGASDANAFQESGIPSVNLGDGSIDTHTPAERIRAEDLERLVDLIVAIPEAAAIS